MILAQRLRMCASPPPPSGVQIITNVFGSLTVPAGVTSMAALLVAQGGQGSSTSFPTAHRPGAGGQASYSDSFAVSPGQSIRFRTVNVTVSGQIIPRYEMYINGVNGNASILTAISGTPGNPPDDNGSGSGSSPLGGQDGTNTNRGGSSGCPSSRNNNATNNSNGFGILAGADSWSHVKDNSAAGWGAASVNTGSTTAAGGWTCILAWGPGKGFSAGPGSYWPFA